MANLSLTASSPSRRTVDPAPLAPNQSDLLARTLERLNEHLATSLAATAKVKDNSRPSD
jgi:hypothetical protein